MEIKENKLLVRIIESMGQEHFFKTWDYLNDVISKFPEIKLEEINDLDNKTHHHYITPYCDMEYREDLFSRQAVQDIFYQLFDILMKKGFFGNSVKSLKPTDIFELCFGDLENCPIEHKLKEELPDNINNDELLEGIAEYNKRIDGVKNYKEPDRWYKYGKSYIVDILLNKVVENSNSWIKLHS